MSTNSRTRTRSGCRGKKHNPAAKTHTEDNCWAIHPEKKEKYLAAQHHTTAVSSQHQVPAFAAITTAHCHLTRAPGPTTVLDSGASHHMFNRLEFFENTEVCSIPISTGRNSTDLSAIRVGTAVISQSDGRILRLKDSLFVPGLSRNLLSLTKLVKRSALIQREDQVTRVTIDDSISFICHHHNDILEVAGEIGPVSRGIFALISTTHSTAISTFETWHRRLGHASISRIKSVLPGVSLEKSGSCDSCMKGKVARVPYNGHFDLTHQPLEVIHADLVGPITPSTNSGAWYFLTLVDQHTGFISVTLLKRKSDATTAILDFKDFYEKQTDSSMKKLISDGGGEFCNKTLSAILKSHGIQHNVSPPYTPQHNGIAERANKTIINMARCMLVQSRLAKEWWGEAVRTAALTTNCLPSLSKSRVSPLEQLMKKVPNMAFFRPFGCKAWVIKPAEKRTSKFDAISWDAILLGYSNDYSCYRVVKVESMEITDTKQAYFDESVFPPLRALCPSNDLLPHASLPDFLSTAILPYDDDDEDPPPAPAHSHHEDEVMDEDLPDHEDEVMAEEDVDSPVDDQESSGSNQPRRRLILRLGPHPTRVTSDINPSNILARRTRGPVAFSVTSTEPSNHRQAMSCDDNIQWKAAEAAEISNMMKHNVWTVIPLLPHHHTIPSTWAYKKKLGADNQVVEFKARICAQGFRQTYGLNFELKYAPTGKPSSLRFLLSIAIERGLLIHQLDVKSAFLTCDLDEEVLMLPPAGYLADQRVVLRLNKAIYGLKQASLAWYRRLNTFLVSIGFSVSDADPCVFWRQDPTPLWIFAHVDDLIIIGSDPLFFRSQMEKEFQIKYMGDAAFLLGMKLDRHTSGIVLHQCQYIQRKLVEFAAFDLPPASCPLDPKSRLSKASASDHNQFLALNINYRSLIGSLNHLSVLTRPDISFAISKLSQFLENPGLTHYTAAMQVLRFLHGTMYRGLNFKKQDIYTLKTFIDADWANCPDTRRSHTGFLVLRDSHLISWKSTKQATVSLSSTEAEYKALADACKDIVWIRNLSSEILTDSNTDPAITYVDNRGAIDLALSQISQNGFRTKHMDLRLHFIRDLIAQNLVKITYVASNRNIADFLTKPVGRLNITRAIVTFSTNASSISALCSQAPSMSACQNMSRSVAHDDDTLMQSISESIT
jgi:transposase InsO family protein